ncbi:MAG: anhydro-N-acetylmuramic acid kinase [Pseudomonadota bacterium]
MKSDRAMAPGSHLADANATLTALGVISGTSMDGIDVACLTTDGDGALTRGPSLMHPYTDDVRALLRAAMVDAATAPTGATRTQALAAAEAAVTVSHGNAIAALLRETGPVDLIGWHGQTVFHAPARRMTMQLGDGAALAARFGIPVVYDFRSADVAAGGEGAPLVPAYHRAMVRAAGVAEPCAVLNLGGVANLTLIDGERLIAFDTGPASAMIDDQMATIGARFDENGALAATGTVDRAALATLLSHPFFDAPAPKSLDRDAFSAAPVAGLALPDRVATLTRFSAEAIARGLAPHGMPGTIIAAGGGTHNATLMRFIAEATGAKFTTVSAIGHDPDTVEAEAFAYLAVRSQKGWPITFPGTTGIKAPLKGGVKASPRA